jgi:hypothetical protein
METSKPEIGDLVFFPAYIKFGKVVEILFSEEGDHYSVAVVWPDLVKSIPNQRCVDEVPSKYLIFDKDHSDKTKLILILKYGNKQT